MGIEKLKDALEKLENTYHNQNGYNVKEILRELNIAITDTTQKQCRAKLRSLIDKELSPEFATAGDEDIVYCPNGKWSGTYKLSKYRGK
ncbi:MAG: hypothetical protein HFE47_06860 [Clostridia bacterium]|nr:hypothetical protein [Clostridia bacterium]